MACPSCGRAVRAGARFCGACGTSLVPRCPTCGAENEPELRFCEACGVSLGPAGPADPAVARKVVTIVFADLIGSTALHERLDPESVSHVMEAYHGAVRAPIEAHGGTVVQLLGDGVMCAFGVTHVAEDDALRAVRAAVAVQEAFREFAREHRLADRVGLRVAVNTGEVVVSDDYAAGIGDPLNVAARLQQEAKDGDVLVGEATQRHVRERVTLAPFGTFALKGRAEPVAAYRVVSLERPAGAPATAFIGRDDELRRILTVYEAALAAPATRLAVLLGSPGLGKSRLLDEVMRRLAGRATVLSARCEAAGSATFAPLATALRTLLGIDEGGADDLHAAIEHVVPGAEAERARIAAGIEALLAGTPASPEETFYDVRRLLAALATEQPVVLVIDDLHWAEPLLLDLIEHLVQWGAGVPLLLLAAARPELREARSSLAAPGAVAADVVTLAGLDATAATRLAASVIGADALPAAIAGRVLTTSEGNPLFLGELVRMLVNDGVLKREGERWTLGVALEELDIPPTIHALLAARIERLRPEDRLVLERAAVVGRHFSRAAVAQLLPRESGDLGARLESLRRSELIEPDTGWFLGEPALRFHHVLIRDAAYRRVLKNTRAELHARLADWIEARPGEHDETLGWHLEQAHQNLRELGTLDERGRVLGERAARHLGAAGRRALARDDLPLAASLLGRALDRLDVADPARADLALDWCEALLSAGDVGPAAEAVAELGRFSAGSERLAAWYTCFTGQLAVLTDPAALRTTASAVASAAEVLASAGDAAGEAKAHAVHATALQRLGEIGACEAALDRALAAARRVHDRRRQNAVLAGAPVAALWGPSPVTRASGRCLDVVRVLRITQGAPAVEAVALRCQAVLEALRGRSDAARRMIAASRRMVEELGITQQLLEADVFAGHIDLLEGDAAAAERTLRGAYEGLREHGLGIDAARAAALLGRALLAEGRAAEAEALSHESEALAGDDLKAAIAWRGVRAEALAERGDAAAAVELARAAVGIAAVTDVVLDHADARLALAVALRAAGHLAEADVEEARAIELWDQKGATLLAERARRRAVRGPWEARAPEARMEPPRPEHRRLRPNRGTAHAARLNEAIAARDMDAIHALHAEGFQAVLHPTGVVLDRQQTLAWWRLYVDDRDVSFRVEPIATLGVSLALCRQSLIGRASDDAAMEVGAYQNDSIALIEGDEQARIERLEEFAPDRLGDAIAKLYERYAELLPEGPERTRAAAVAHTVAALVGPPDPERRADLFAPDIEFVDPRAVGPGTVHGAEALVRTFRAIWELAEEFTNRIDDVLAVRPDALLVRWTNTGVDRSSGGAFERNLCQLWIFGADGLITRWEQSDAERTEEALARFDALTAKAPRAVALRRVRPNAATENVARLNAAGAAGNFDALASLLADGLEIVSRTTGIVLDRSAVLDWWRLFFTDRDATFRLTPVATLGESLALCHHTWTGSASAGASFDVGAFEMEMFFVYEVDAERRTVWVEAFGHDHFGGALARLYERYAELLPEGPERKRFAEVARSVAAMLTPPDVGRWMPALAREVEFVDHRTLGLGSTGSRERIARAIAAQQELARELVTDIEGVLDLRRDALLVDRTDRGVDRSGGGGYERSFLLFLLFGTDGFVSRWEIFDSDREVEGLARFGLLTAAPPTARRRVHPNRATAHAARFAAAFAARDEASIGELFSARVETLHHPTGSTWDRQGTLDVLREALLPARSVDYHQEPLASLGASLALARASISAAGGAPFGLDVGPSEMEMVYLLEVDAEGRQRRSEAFAGDRLGDAVVRLYERYAELLPESAERTSAETTARLIAIWLQGHQDLPESLIAPEMEFVDRRPLGLGRARGAEHFMRGIRAGRELEHAGASCVHDLFEVRPAATLLRMTMSGTDASGGGPFERELVRLWLFAADGRLVREEWFEPDSADEALARFDALTAAAPARRRPVRPNAATRNAERFDAAVAARDLAAVADLFPESSQTLHHPTGAAYDRDGILTSIRGLFGTFGDFVRREEPLATLGESLGLFRASLSAASFLDDRFDVGPLERENINLIEVDAQGLRGRTEIFAADRLGDAVARLYARHAELLSEGLEHVRAQMTAHVLARQLRAEPMQESLISPDVEFTDHRPLGMGRVRGVDGYMGGHRLGRELESEPAIHVHEILALRPGAILLRWTSSGVESRGGGAFERALLMLYTYADDGRLTHTEWFDPSQEAEALARFEELCAGLEGAHLPR